MAISERLAALAEAGDAELARLANEPAPFVDWAEWVLHGTEAVFLAAKLRVEHGDKLDPDTLAEADARTENALNFLSRGVAGMRGAWQRERAADETDESDA